MVPSFVELTAPEANMLAAEYGLNISFKGAVASGGTCSSQDLAEGKEVSPGTVVTLTFAAASGGGFND